MSNSSFTEDLESKAIGCGMAIAAQIVVSVFREKQIAKEILSAAGYDYFQSMIDDGVDDYDLKILKELYSGIGHSPKFWKLK